jgi:hypothetical protein
LNEAFTKRSSSTSCGYARWKSTCPRTKRTIRQPDDCRGCPFLRLDTSASWG